MGFTGYITWDDTYAFFGMDGADIGGCSSTKWLLIYLSGTPGTTTGVQYNNQQPALPFSAKYHVRWKADNTYTNAMEYSVSNWVDAGWNFTGDVFQSGTFLEMRVPFADIGSPAAFSVVMCMINEAGGSEWTYAGVPDTVFSDGVDPDYGHYYQFDLTGSTPPNQYVPVALY